MYLHKLVLENMGPFGEPISIDFPFDEHNRPHPVILVGRNGAGKTTLLSSIVDALHEFAVQHFNDVLPESATGRAYFRISGHQNIKVGSSFGFCYLQFRHENTELSFIDKVGDIPLNTLESKIGAKLNLDGWNDTDRLKLSTKSEVFRTIFPNEVFVYFPSHRAEMPHWLNSDNPIVKAAFLGKRRFSGKLEKPIVLAESADTNAAWLLDVVLDTHLYGDTALWNAANYILRGVLNDPNVRFGVGPRTDNIRIGICDQKGAVIIPSVSHLSGGQATLLNLGLSILRYGDKGKRTKLEEITGVVVVDEIDSHLHTQLQAELLPKLLMLFPRIQFIVTSHSPVFLLGMERVFGGQRFQIRELPRCGVLGAQQFMEYNAVLQALDVSVATSSSNKEVVLLVEGTTDHKILDKAWAKLRADRARPFDIVDSYGCQFIRNTMKQEDIFLGSPGKVFIGLLDFDGAFEVWNSLVSDRGGNWIEDSANSDEAGLVASHRRFKGHVALLPVPDFRAAFAGRRFRGSSSVTIEMLFADEHVSSFLRFEDLPGGGKRLVFRAERKTEFAESVDRLPAEAFVQFERVFALLDDIIAGRRGRTGA